MIISFIVPCFNEQEVIPIFYDELLKSVSEISPDFELIFIDDGSTDNSLLEIKKIKEKDPRVRFISFSRNFGKESAVWAGLEASKGDNVVILDVDLQDPVSLLPELYKAVNQDDYDCAVVVRTSRKGEPIIRSLFANLFYKLTRHVFNINIVEGTRDYRLVNRKVVNELLKLKERNKITKGLFPWAGFSTKYFEFENLPRVKGKTKWSFKKLFFYGIGIILSFSQVPIYIISLLGLLFFAISIFMIAAILIKTFIYGETINNLVILSSMILFMGGIQLFCLGVLGLYLGMVYKEVKDRPLYLVKEEG